MPDAGRALRAALRLGPRGWQDLALATLELARARWRLRRYSGRELIELGRRQATPDRPPPSDAEALVERVRFVVPRVAARVPWRADCWVQALAAQAWLARAGVASDLWIGVRRDRGPGLEAHAWLRWQERVITGGDIAGFAPLVSPGSRP